MLFFVDNRGTVISGKPSPVYQGAADTNNIVLVAPYAANLQLAVAFTLPNGVNTQPYMMTRGGAVNGVEFAPTGTGMAVWTFSMPSEITAHSGTVYAQFYAYGTNGQITPTSRISFSVAKGVEADLPDTPEQNIYNQILTALSQLTSQLNDGAYAARAIYWWIDTFTYGMNEVTFYPVGTYGAFVRSIAENNTGNQPYGDDSALDSAHWQELVNFNKIYAAEQNASAAAEAAATSATAAAASAKQAGDSATAAEQSVQKAAVNAQSAAASAESAEESANDAATSAQSAAASAKSAQESATKAEQSAGAAAEVSITLFDINFDDIDSDEGVVLPPEINEKRLTNPANLVIRCVPPSDLSSSSSIIMLYPNTGRSSLSVYWGNIVEDNYGLYRIAIGFLTDGHCYIVHNEYILPAMNPQTDKGKALVVGDEYYALEERIAPLAVSNVAKAYVSQENTGDTIGVEISQQTKAYTIAQRDGSGNLKTNTPSVADDVAPKSYVDAETERSKEQEQAIAQQVETLSQNINNSLSQKQNITDNTLETTAKTIPAAINENKQAIDGLRNDMTAQDHFKGFADTAADVQKITGDLNDFVYCIGTGTIWTYGASGWADSGKPYPSDATPLGTTTPLMDGTGAAGTSASAARSDHVHPTDTSRASATALQEESEARTTAVNTVQTALTAEITRAKNAEQANATAAANAQNTANSKYTKPSSGIPATDLAQAVQDSLEKANSALQSIPAASPTVLGGVKPIAKTAAMTQQVGVDENGALFTAPAACGGGGEVIDLGTFENLPTAGTPITISDPDIIAKLKIGNSIKFTMAPSDISSAGFVFSGVILSEINAPIEGLEAKLFDGILSYSDMDGVVIKPATFAIQLVYQDGALLAAQFSYSDSISTWGNLDANLGKAIVVAESGQKVKFVPIPPEPTAQDAGKVPVVNSTGNGYELKEVSSVAGGGSTGQTFGVIKISEDYVGNLTGPVEAGWQEIINQYKPFVVVAYGSEKLFVFAEFNLEYNYLFYSFDNSLNKQFLKIDISGNFTIINEAHEGGSSQPE